MADEQRDEKPTQRRLERARKEGDFPASREFLSSVHFLGFVAIAVTFSGVFLVRIARIMRSLLARAFTIELTPREVVSLMRDVVAPALEPVLIAGIALMLLVVFVQLTSTKMGISLSKLMPDFKRLNFLRRFSSVPQQNLPMFLQALLLLPVIALVVYYEVTENLNSFLDLPWMAAPVAVSLVAGTLQT